MKIVSSVLLVLASLLCVSAMAASPLVPPNATVAGKSIGEWAAEYWKWEISIPANDNPSLSFDATGEKAKYGNVGPVFFLPGWIGSAAPASSITRSITIPEGKHIFVPVWAATDDNVGYGCTVASTTPCAGRLTIDQLFTQLAPVIDAATSVEASVDGVAVSDMANRRTTSPAFSYTLQLTDNVDQLGSFHYAGPDAIGTVFPVVADGWYLMLRPLPAGQHTVQISANPPYPGPYSITYEITIVPATSSEPAVLIP